MTKNPVFNALGAALYILLVVSVLQYLGLVLGNKPDTFFAPVIFLSMLTLSASVMAYVFFYQPVQMYIDGKKKEAGDLFIKTIGVFGGITVVGLILLLLRVI